MERNDKKGEMKMNSETLMWVAILVTFLVSIREYIHKAIYDIARYIEFKKVTKRSTSFNSLKENNLYHLENDNVLQELSKTFVQEASTRERDKAAIAEYEKTLKG